MFMGAAFTKSVTDGISRRHLDKYYFPLLKVAALLFPVFIWEPVLVGDGVFMSCRGYLNAVGGYVSPAVVSRLSKNWIKVV